MIGVHMHIGSQITTTEPYAGAAGKAVDMIAQFRAMGHPIAWFNMGGGFGIGYRGREARPSPSSPRRWSRRSRRPGAGWRWSRGG